jgi:TatA/E family protein of Tat protein translocase
MGPLGWQETMAIAILALLIFGPKKLPELFSQAGKALAQFRKASTDLKATWEREMTVIREEGESLREEAKKAYYDDNDQSNSYYDSPYDDPYASDYPATPSSDASETADTSSDDSAQTETETETDNPNTSTASNSGDDGQTKTDSSMSAKRPAPEGTVAQGSESA